MSKAKLEEAVELVAKYELFRHDGKFNERVAALIDEVRSEKALEYVTLFGELQNALDETDKLRGIDTEPVAWINAEDLARMRMAGRGGIVWPHEQKGAETALYTRPAPSQPAAPVAEVRTSLKKCVADAKETSGAYWKAYAESLAEDFDALATQYLALKNVAPVELPVVADGMKLTVIRHWPEGFEDRLQLVWLDVVSFIPNVKLYDLQRVLAEFGFRMEVYEDAQAAIAAAQSQPAPPEIMTLHNRIAELTAQHGSLRAAAAVINIDVGYLSRLASDEKVKPGKEFLRRMGLRAFTTYERIK